MFSLTSSYRYFFYSLPTDMRKSFDGLQGLVQNKLRRDPASGEVFVFVNKRRNRIKLLHWEAGGFVLYYKRLEKGTVELPEMSGKSGRPGEEISWSYLVMIVEGISVKGIKKRERFLLKKQA
jgi:transposase